MNKEILGEVFEEVISSPVGQYLVNYFCNREIKEPLFVSFIDSLKELIVNQSEVSHNEFKNFLENRISEIINVYGHESEISLGLMTFKQILYEKNQKHYYVSTRSVKKEVDGFLDSISAIIYSIPDTKQEFSVLLQNAESNKQKKNENAAENVIQVSLEEISRIHSLIQQIDSDQVTSDIAHLIRRYEPEFSSQNSILSLNLSDCSPHTINKIRKYLVK